MVLYFRVDRETGGYFIWESWFPVCVEDSHVAFRRASLEDIPTNSGCGFPLLTKSLSALTLPSFMINAFVTGVRRFLTMALIRIYLIQVTIRSLSYTCDVRLGRTQLISSPRF